MGTVFGKNTTSSSITVAGHKVYYIDSTDAEIVEVQDGNNVKYNAFKFTLSGTPYWYVIDGEHDTWTDDLSAWGYSEVQPVAELPEVTTNKWSCPAVGSGIATLSPNATYLLWNNLTDQSNISYDDSLAYAVNFWKDADNNLGGHIELSLIKLASKLGIQNNSNQTLTVYWVNYSTCSDSTATVVTVYNSSNVAYNAFKFTANNVDYYYVLDGTQTEWTDDLGSIGYSLTPVVVLPTVSIAGDFGDYNWVTPGSNPPVLMVADGVYNGYVNGNYPAYDSTKVYGIIQWQTSPGTRAGAIEVSVVSNSGLVALKNVSSSTINVYQAKVAVCSSNQATVVTVYNSSNVAYNAFKFTANNVDYYYVLDGTQTDWTDDLSSIGYSLYVKAWFTSDKSGKSIDTSYPGNSGLLYDSQGAFIDFQSGSTYTTVAVYNTSQQAVSGIDSSNFILEDNGGGYLSFKNRSTKAPTALYVEYTVS